MLRYFKKSLDTLGKKIVALLEILPIVSNHAF
jgi:hypothetical protein